ncbi:aldehyde dehydrogenase family protein [Streptomyces sp. NPDC007896]
MPGRHVIRSSAQYLKTTSMELGGKSPAVVFADVGRDARMSQTLFIGGT